MNSDDYRIMAIETVVLAWPINEAGERPDGAATTMLEQMPPISGWPEYIYGVVDSNNNLLNTFETLDEAREYIREETE